MVVAPYQEHRTNHITVRWFDEGCEASELVWHRDAENRVIRVVQGTGWKFQFDNELPQPLDAGAIIYVAKDRYHRIIKGQGPLVVEIIEESATLVQK